MIDPNDKAACAVVGALFPHVGASLAARVKANARKASQARREARGRQAGGGGGGWSLSAMGQPRDQTPYGQLDPYGQPSDPYGAAPQYIPPPQYGAAPGLPPGYQLPPQYGGNQTPWFVEQAPYVPGGGYGGYPSADEGGYYDGAPEGSDY